MIKFLSLYKVLIMRFNKNTLAYILLFILFIVLFSWYNLNSTNHQEAKPVRDLSEISESKTLKIVASSNFIDYFVYNGTPMGFYLELINDFANRHNFNVEIIVGKTTLNSISMVENFDCDIYACNWIIPAPTIRDLIATIPVRTSNYVLIQRKPDYYWNLNNEQVENSLIKNIKDLTPDKKIYTDDMSTKIYNLNIPNIVVVDSISIEQIIKMVSDKTLDYAIADLCVAQVLSSYYNNLDIKTEIGKAKDIAWYVRKNSPELLNSLNNWLTEIKTSEKYAELEKKYISQNRMLVNLHSEYYSGNEGKISIYDDLIKEYCKIANWDWRLLASLIYKESRFDPDAVSWAGAVGLMQLMPYTYADLSNDTTWSIPSQLNAGTKYIKYLTSLVPKNIEDTITKTKMVLAGYNIGFGHVEDAIRLSEKYNKDPNSWENISYYLTNLSNHKYYTDSVVKFGYFPGVHSVDFANSIYDRFLHYRNVIPK
jgi:membrane-bound lytic murein transglycosylase F